jgi:cytochrome P450
MTTVEIRKIGGNPLAITAQMRSDPLGLMMQLQRDYGDLVLVVDLPTLKSYAVFSPEIAYEMLVKQADRFVKPELGKKMMASSFGNGIFFSDGDFWRRQRKLAQPAFYHTRLTNYADAMVKSTDALLTRWRSLSEVEINKEMHALTLVIVTHALFKTDVSGLTDRVGDAMNDLGRAVGDQSRSILAAMLPNWVPTPLNRRKQRAIDIINPILHTMIAEHRAANEDKGDLLSALMQVQDEETGERMSDQQVRDEVMTMFIAGHETSALALTWALILIARHPEVESKLRAEIKSVLAGHLPTLADIPALPYTAMVIKETLRLYPPAPFIARQPADNIEFMGVKLPKSAVINIMPYVIHRDPRWFENPNDFVPDRFAGDFEKQLPKCAYIPFGTGPRVCIGNGFAMLEMQLVLAAIIQRYRVSLLPDQGEIKPTMNLTLGFDRPVKMKIVKLEPAKS